MHPLYLHRPGGWLGAGPTSSFVGNSCTRLGAGLLLLLLLASPAWAQGELSPATEAPLPHPVLVNLKGGFNLSTYTGGSYIGWETGLKGGFSGGFLATQVLSARSAWQVELLYSRKGAVAYNYYHTYAPPAPTTGPKKNIYRSELHYLDLPVLLTFGPGSGSRTGWYVAAGPQLSLALDKQETVVPDGGSDPESYEETLNGDTKSLQRLGAGYVAGIGRQWINYGIELRYSGDITNVYRGGYGSGALYAGSSNRFHNGVIQLQVNLALRGGHWVRGNGSEPPYYPADTAPAPPPRSRPQPLPPREQPRPPRPRSGQL